MLLHNNDNEIKRIINYGPLTNDKVKFYLNLILATKDIPSPKKIKKMMVNFSSCATNDNEVRMI